MTLIERYDAFDACKRDDPKRWERYTRLPHPSVMPAWAYYWQWVNEGARRGERVTAPVTRPENPTKGNDNDHSTERTNARTI
jgi:hypothetical protein